MSALHLFDMDGTLLRGTTACLQMAQTMGRVEDLVALETRFAAGDLDAPGFAVAIRAMWPDLTSTVVAAAFAAGPWLAGIEEVCADIRRRGEHSAVITLSPDFFAGLLLDVGFDDVMASRFPPLPFAAPVDPTGVLGPADKVDIVERLRVRHGVPRSRCVAYGDSMSDAPLFRHLDATVAVNADHHLVGLAAASYHGDDLAAAYALGRALLPPAAVDGRTDQGRTDQVSAGGSDSGSDGRGGGDVAAMTPAG